MRLKASLVMVSLPSNNIEQSKAFLQGLLGIDFVRNLDEQTESYHTPISEDGIDLHVSPPRHPQEAPMVYFHVDDLDATIRQAVNTGGSLLFGPQAITISDRAFVAYEEAYRQAERGGPRATPQVCRMAIIQDPGGSAIGLLQVEPHMHRHFQVGTHHKELADWQVEHRNRGMGVARRVFGGGA